MRGKRNAKTAAPVEEAENYSVDEIATLVSAGKGKKSGKKVAVETPTTDPVADVAELPVAKPKGRGKKVIVEVENEIPQENGNSAAVVKNTRKRDVTDNEDENKIPAKRVRGKKEPVNAAADDEVEVNKVEVEVKPKTNNRRGKKVTTKIEEEEKEEEEEVVVKTTKGRGKKEVKVKAPEEIKNAEPVRVSRRQAKTPVEPEVEKPKTVKDQKKRNNKKNPIKEEESMPEQVDTPVEKEEEEKEEEPKAKKGKKPTAAKKPVTKGNQKVPPHITADEEPAQELVETKTRKRGATKIETNGEQEATTDKKVFKNATVTNYSDTSFDTKKPYTLKISTWNVAGIRSWLKKGGFEFLKYESPDIFCLQETKCDEEQLPEEAVNVNGYHRYWLCMPGGYAGVAIYSRIMPIHIEYGIGNEEFDKAGRIITAEYEKFYLINVYVPNSGRKLVNLDSRMDWEQIFLEHVKRYDKLKPVIICGDMNVSHQEIDLANPKSNLRNAGFTIEERDKMTQLLAAGFVDTFRHLYPKKTGAYTFWSYMGNARARNVGWRLDYFITSQRLLPTLVDQELRANILGSDHCPITLFLNI